MGTLVVIPTYNERENLEHVVERLRSAVPHASVLVVDDHSPDGTGQIADRLADADPHVHVLHREGKEGLGAAYRAGFAWGFAAGFDILVEMDADGSHRPEQLPALLAQLDDSDVVLGSRWVRGGGVENWPAARRMLSRGGSLYARLALGIPVKDVTGGFRAFRGDALERIRFDETTSQGYCFQIDMLWRAHRAGLRIREVPITFVERQHGVSKMTLDIVIEAMLRVTGWGIAALPGRWKRAARARQAVRQPE